MSRVIKVDKFFVEADEGSFVVGKSGAAGGLVLEPVGGVGLSDVAEKVTSAGDTIAAVCEYVRGAFDKANHPDDLKLKFGIKLGGSVGIPYVAKAAGEATIEIEATWKNPTANKAAEK